MIVLDTTVLLYAVGADHALRDPAHRLLTALADGGVRMTTTPEVLQEFSHVRARRRTRADAVRLARDFATAFAPLILTDGEDLAEGLAIYEERDALGAFDAVLAAVARRRDATLVSADHTFGVVDGLRFADLADEDALARLLEG